MLEYKSLFVALFFASIIAIEYANPYRKHSGDAIARMVKNSGLWVINIALSLAVILPISYWASRIDLWNLESSLWITLTHLLLLDLFIYWWHRIVHEVPFLWRFHIVHHLDEHLDSTSAVRFHFGEILMSSIARSCVIIIFSVTFKTILIFETLVLICAIFQHSNTKLPVKLDSILSKVIITPGIHWIHHHARRCDTDSNYGTIFSFWDRIFSSFNAMQRSNTMKLGIDKMHDENFLDLIKRPLNVKKPPS